MMALSPAARISLGLVSLTIGILGLGDLLGFLPDPRTEIAESRQDGVKMLAVQFVLAAEDNDLAAMRTTLTRFSEEYEGLRGAVLRRPDGRIQILLSDFAEDRPDEASLNHAKIPIFLHKRNLRPFPKLP